MRWTVIAAGLSVLLLASGTGCGGASHRSDSALDADEGGYGYGDMFASRDREESGGYRSAVTTPAAAPPPSYGGGGDMAESVAEEPEPMDDSPAPMVMAARASSRAPVGGSSGLGGAGAYDFEDDTVEGDMAGEAASAPPPAPPARPQVAEASRPTPPAGPRPAEATPAEGGEGGEPAQVADAGSGGPLLIYEATLNLAVHEVREKMADVIEIADDVGGFLQRQDDTTVIIRVPARRFRETLERVEGVGDVLSRRVSAQDVSERFRDIRIRLRNAVEMRDRMAELLQRADTVPDSLTIQRELERLTQEIELYRGQLRALEDRIAFSTITVLFQPIRVDAEVPRERFRLPFPWLDRLGLPHLMELR